MRLWALALSALLALAQTAFAQDTNTSNKSNPEAGAASQTMAQLLAQKYEIKAAVPNGSRFIVFMQKDQSAYACEFASLATSRCGAIK
ncbi:hypothetical protein [Pararhizobium sp.]|uniref:hypothetical protein n=1 Tax=Pararhizobium sp. TaxID=1977563 RepID=UPI00271EFF8C|nr:hypothetical protein [Pararhizobium sp.]MDO9415927.1 hypothetical protein [Pararhizobium sp.]